MKTIISGRLIKTPEMKKVNLKDGRMEFVCDYAIWVADPAAPKQTAADGKEYTRDVPFSCTAWGSNAYHVSQMKAGDILTGSYTMRAKEIKPGNSDKTIVQPVYTLNKIDHNNTIQKQMSELLTGFERGQYDEISKPETQPSFGGELSMDTDKDITEEKDAEVEME